MRRLVLIAAVATVGGALVAPTAAHASTVTQVVTTATCFGGPGTATAVSAPAADGTTTGSLTLSGVPDGTWNGGTGVAGGADATAGITSAPQTVTGGTFSASTTSPTPWGSGLVIGAYASTTTGELCEAAAGSMGATALAGTVNAVLAVHAVHNLAAAVTLPGFGKGRRLKLALVVKAGTTQRRTLTVVTKKANQTVLIKGFKQVKPLTTVSLVITDLKSHRKEHITLRRVLV